MNFMVSATFGKQDSAEIMPRIPQEQARIGALKEQGVVKELYVSSDLSHVWIVMQGKSQEQIHEHLQTLPLYNYMALEVLALSAM